jgi:hypothetical protein
MVTHRCKDQGTTYLMVTHKCKDQGTTYVLITHRCKDPGKNIFESNLFFFFPVVVRVVLVIEKVIVLSEWRPRSDRRRRFGPLNKIKNLGSIS